METNINKLQFRNFGAKNSTTYNPDSVQNAVRVQNVVKIFVLLLCLSTNVLAQQRLTETELKKFGSTAENKINELQNCITTIADKSRADFDRDKAIESALRLFIKDAKMQVSILYQSGKTEVSTFPIDKYFHRLKALRFKEVKIRFYNLFYLSDFIRDADGNYHAAATIYQEFTAIDNEGRVYKDKTKKTIDIILEYVEDPFFKEHRWMLKLGDVNVLETRAA